MSGHSQFDLLRRRRFLPFFLAQATGAFNDNLYKNALIVLIAFKIAGLTSAQIDLYSNLAAGLFILPFFLFSATAGQWAEKVEKSRAIAQVKLLEIAIMVAAGFALWSSSLPFLLAVLFLLGTQSALFGPLKYSILPQALKPAELVGGNALVEAGTFLAILTGTLAGGVLINLDKGKLAVTLALLVVAIAGWLAARAIPQAPASSPGLKINWNPVSETWRNLTFLRGHRAVLNSVLGVSWFWFFGSIFVAQLPNYTRLYLGGDATVTPLVLMLFSLGIGAGSLLCEVLSRRTVEIGLVPLGALGLTLFGVDLYFARPEMTDITGLSWREFLAAAGNLRICFDLVAIGISGGLYVVPLFALIQQRAPAEHLSRTIAANNILNAAFMVAAAVMAIAVLNLGLMFGIHINVPQLLLITALLNAAVAIYIFTLVPEFVARFLAWMAAKALYRLEVKGIEQVPDHGAALVVCNHVSFMDAVLVMGALPRPARFVMYYKIFRQPLMNIVFRAARAIPIAGIKEDEALMEDAFAKIDAALAEGEIVGIFPEGGLTTDGEIAQFRKGVERILATRPVPVVPMALCGMWESMWSRRDSALARARLPRRFRAHVELRVGAPVSPEEASAEALEAKVRELRGADR